VGRVVCRGAVLDSIRFVDIFVGGSSWLCVAPNLVDHGSQRTLQALATCCILGPWYLLLHIRVPLSMDLRAQPHDLPHERHHRLGAVPSGEPRSIGVRCSRRHSWSRELSSRHGRYGCDLFHPDHVRSDLAVGSRGGVALVRHVSSICVEATSAGSMGRPEASTQAQQGGRELKLSWRNGDSLGKRSIGIGLGSRISRSDQEMRVMSMIRLLCEIERR